VDSKRIRCITHQGGVRTGRKKKSQGPIESLETSGGKRDNPNPIKRSKKRREEKKKRYIGVKKSDYEFGVGFGLVSKRGGEVAEKKTNWGPYLVLMHRRKNTMMREDSCGRAKSWG